MCIILIGYMGCGKSTIAKQLALELDLTMIDLDDYITDKENDTITNIFKSKGEIYFRKLENKVLKEILATQNKYVLAVGGGTPCYGNNMGLISQYTTSIYLKASIQTLYDRLILEKAQRPLLKNLNNNKLKEFIAKHLFERSSFYEKATYTIKIDSKSIDNIVNEINLNMQ